VKTKGERLVLLHVARDACEELLRDNEGMKYDNIPRDMIISLLEEKLSDFSRNVEAEYDDYLRSVIESRSFPSRPKPDRRVVLIACTANANIGAGTRMRSSGADYVWNKPRPPNEDCFKDIYDHFSQF